MEGAETVAVIVAIMGVFTGFWAIQRLVLRSWRSMLGALLVQAGLSLGLITLFVALSQRPPLEEEAVVRLMVTVALPSFCLNVVSALAILGRRVGSAAAAV